MSSRRKDKPSVAAAKASFSTPTAYRIECDLRPPSQKQTPRTRHRPDPLAGIFDEEVVPLLVETPYPQAVTIFDELCRRHPQLPTGVLRTLERHVRQWRALHDPNRGHLRPEASTRSPGPVRFHRQPNNLGVTIGGALLVHLLYHFRLPYSCFEYADVVLGGESLVALSRGCQNALWRPNMCFATLQPAMS